MVRLPRKCGSCGETKGVFRYEVTLQGKLFARRYAVWQCRPCWKSFDAVVDGVSETIEDGLFGRDHSVHTGGAIRARMLH